MGRYTSRILNDWKQRSETCLVINIPDWLLSHIHHLAKRGKHLTSLKLKMHIRKGNCKLKKLNFSYSYFLLHMQYITPSFNACNDSFSKRPPPHRPAAFSRNSVPASKYFSSTELHHRKRTERSVLDQVKGIYC